MLTVGSLFSGIGGFDLGLERAGFEIRWQVELDGSWEDGLRRVAHGTPKRVDRLRGLGNALVPQIAEWLGRQILAAEEGD